MTETTTVAPTGRTAAPPSAPRRLVWLLAVASGLTAANLYYCQPLLPRIAQDFGTGQAAVGTLVTSTQIGYGLGLLLLVPLGDIVRRRRLVSVLLIGEAAALVLSAAAPALWVLLAAGTAVGLGASVVQILTPYAATVAAEHERGKVVAFLLTGVLTGVLLSRTVSGLAAEAFGWRAVFLGAAAVALLLATALGRIIEPSEPEVALGYGAQLRATLALMRSERVLRRRSLIGACVFGAFGVFWSTSPFLLAGPHYHYSEAGIGGFALVGVAGTIASRQAGRAADAGRQRPLTGALLALGLASFAALLAGGHSLVWLIVGVLLLDVAVHGTHLLNMSVVYGLVGAARSRIASAYMTSYYIGGALGSATATQAYHYAGWPAVCTTGATFLAVALFAWAKE